MKGTIRIGSLNLSRSPCLSGRPPCQARDHWRYLMGFNRIEYNDAERELTAELESRKAVTPISNLGLLPT
jgi:hypothetical protein